MDVENRWGFIKQQDKLMEVKNKSLRVIKYGIDLYGVGTHKLLEADWVFWGSSSNYLLYCDTLL